MKKNHLFLACSMILLCSLSSFRPSSTKSEIPSTITKNPKTIVTVNLSVVNNTTAKATGHAGSYMFSVLSSTPYSGTTTYDNPTGIQLDATLTKIPAGGVDGYWYIDGSTTPLFSYHFTFMTPSIAYSGVVNPATSVSIVFN